MLTQIEHGIKIAEISTSNRKPPATHKHTHIHPGYSHKNENLNK